MPHKILFDTDPGVDDALALLFALRSPELEVVGVTTVYGNAQVEQTTRNALCVLEVAGRTDIPVAAGAARPLVRAYRGKRSHIHGEDALGNTFLPPPSTRPLDIAAAEFIIRTALAHPGEITLVAVGPLTNLALAARLEPRVVSAVRQVIVMGGAAFVPGRVSPVPDVNVDNDPEAAAIVFSAGWPLVMVGLDVTMRTVMTGEYLHHLFPPSDDPLRSNPLTTCLSRIVPVYLQAYRDRYGIDGIPMHDPSAVAYAVDPSLFRVERLPVFVETAIPEIDVCVDVDSPRLLALFKERMQ
ncbi:MAG: uridine nucleosidase [Anaerolineales bacterium]|nr:uridine nucleosidase [Anaerolineales bacterium]